LNFTLLYSDFNFIDYAVAKMYLSINITQTMWYLIDTGFKDPYFNMAYDESLMDFVCNLETVFLRFFNFSPVSISLGYHQKAGDWLRELEAKGIKWVRRRTGGRAIIHSCDCTYSMVFHRNNPLIGGNVVESYKKISHAFKKVFELLGIKTEIERRTLENGKKRKSRMCFSSISLSDLCWGKKKIIGSAQYRNKDVVLQQGTIMLKIPEGFTVDTGVATIEMAAKREINLSELKMLIIKAFESHFGISFESLKKNPLKVEILRKYSSAEWNLKGNF
jgi:lipoate-protein ligase A